ncbi:MAG: (2Fe-2S)-binding protein [Clostridia bacterium]|nr:(2Fe-2S)-binding protein [Clostridia bacterium]
MIDKHPILGDRLVGEKLTITFDGKELEVEAGQTVAAALLNAGYSQFRYTAKEHKKRGIFCGIGRCTDCMMIIDGKPNTRSCITRVHDGMRVETQDGVGKWEE